MGVGSAVISGVGAEITCGDIVARLCAVGAALTRGNVAEGAVVAVGDGTGPDEHAAITPAATAKIPTDILRTNSTFLFL